jgi:hypothetical protein
MIVEIKRLKRACSGKGETTGGYNLATIREICRELKINSRGLRREVVGRLCKFVIPLIVEDVDTLQIEGGEIIDTGLRIWPRIQRKEGPTIFVDRSSSRLSSRYSSRSSSRSSSFGSQMSFSSGEWGRDGGF